MAFMMQFHYVTTGRRLCYDRGRGKYDVQELDRERQKNGKDAAKFDSIATSAA